MAFATKALTSAFKKVWHESPKCSEKEPLTLLKQRLNKAVGGPVEPSAEETSVSSPGSSEGSVALLEKHFRGFPDLALALEEASKEVPSHQSTATPTSLPASKSASPSSECEEKKSSRMEMPEWVPLSMHCVGCFAFLFSFVRLRAI